ncbi:MAG: hypothetical protein KAT68_02085 [Bacteroidales bacterium]|nr:hypothetical protein [Bacteroidales bacterium]
MKKHSLHLKYIGFLTFVFLLISNSCEKKSDIIVYPKINTLNDTIELKYGQTVQIIDENILLKFNDVNEESRCPSGSQCIWQGQATVTIEIKNQEEIEYISLTLRAGNDIINIGEYENYSIKLIKVAPYPEAGIEIDYDNYIIKIIINKTQNETK